MNSDHREKVMGLLKKRKDLLNEMLLTTQVTDLSKGVDSSEDYNAMIEKREQLLAKVTGINELLAKPPLCETFTSGDRKFRDEAQRLYDESKEIAGHIVKLDKSNMVMVESIMDEIKKNLRGIKAGKTVNQHYAFDKTYSGSNYFDKMK